MNTEQTELTDIIYDTLMRNTQFPQLNPDDVDSPEVDASLGIIRLEYKGTSYCLTLQSDSI